MSGKNQGHEDEEVSQPPEIDTTITFQGEQLNASLPETPGLVLAWKPSGLLSDDRAPIEKILSIGRSSQAKWCIPDRHLSRVHFTLSRKRDCFEVTDSGSRNGVFVNGVNVNGNLPAYPGAVIRAGSCVFVIESDLNRLPRITGNQDEEIRGKYHSRRIIKEIEIAAHTKRPILIDGETGSGKELAAKKVHETWRKLGRDRVFVALNAASLINESNAIGSLFGVRKGSFTDVDKRTGALDSAKGGSLFIDELHALPLRVQQSLLRFLDDGLSTIVGDDASRARPLDVRLICATNIDVIDACNAGKLAPDLVARCFRLKIPTLNDRRADIPSIFLHVLRETIDETRASAIEQDLGVIFIERLCLQDYSQGNVRLLVNLASMIVARVSSGESPQQAIGTAMDSMLTKPKKSTRGVPNHDSQAGTSEYDLHRDEIVKVYLEQEGNLTRAEAALRKKGIQCTRRWLAIFLERWGIRPIKR